MGNIKKGWEKIPKLSINRRALKKKLKKAQGATSKHAHKFIIKRLSNVRDSQQHIAKWVFMMGLLIAATGLQLVWHQDKYRTESLATDGIYAEAVLGPLNSLNPILASSNAEQSASRLLFSRLLYYDESGNLNYDLAKSVTKSDDGTELKISIRPDVLWHDGHKLTAEDIVFTVNLIKNPKLNTSIVGLNNISVEKVDDSTIKVLAKSNFVTFTHLLTFPILPKHLLSEASIANIREDAFSSNPIGSGPFKLKYIQDVDLESGRKVVYLSRHENYHRGLAKIDRFQLHVYNDIESIGRALTLNEVNATASLPPHEISHINPKRYDVSVEPIQGGVYAILNTTSNLLSDINLRKSLQLATSHQNLVASIGLDLPDLNSPLMEYHLKEKLEASSYNLDEAKALLDKSGWLLGSNNLRYKDGQELKLSIVVLKDPELEKVLEIIVKQWKELGIKIDTRVIDTSDVSQDAVRTVLRPRAYDVLVRRLFIGADPDVYAYWHSSQAKDDGLNFANYSNRISDDALDTARARSEPKLRAAKYLTFIKQWQKDVPAIGLYQSTIQYIRVKGFASFNKDRILISDLDRYNDVIDWSTGNKSVLKTP